LRPAQQQQIETLIAQFSQQNWQKAVEDLAKIGEPAVDPLIATLRDKNVEHWTVHSRAIDTLAKIATPAAVAAIAEALANKGLNQYARGFAAAALVAQDSEKCTQALARASKDPAQFVRWKSVQSLGKMANPAGTDALISALRDEDQDVRAAAVTSLGQVQSAGATEAVVNALRDDYWLVRFNARNVLVEAKELPVDSLIMALKDRKSQVRWQAAAILGRTRTMRATEALARVVAERDWMVRDQAAVALARIRTDQATGDVSDSRYCHPVVLKTKSLPRHGKTLPVLPATFDKAPTFTSPCLLSDGMEALTIIRGDGKYSLVAVTVENGSPLAYKKNLLGKGWQLAVDAADFPTLAETGLHSDAELDQTKTITDRSIVEITELGRPERSSGAGFMAADEDIVSVLKGDNEFVKAMELTHPQMAVPLFHIWNIVLDGNRRNLRFGTEFILYNGMRVEFKFEGSKGWQESIFDDEILGKYQFVLSRQLSEDEMSFLRTKYRRLTDKQMEELIAKLSHIHSGEMVPYYIMRYGFYEGHTDYRADPIAIAFVFGLRTLEQIEAAFEGRLYEALTRHFPREEAGR
jgi:HEAT repeat protein